MATDDRRDMPWHSSQGMVAGPRWSVAQILDETYKTAHFLTQYHQPRSKENFFKHMNRSKRTFNGYMAGVGMQWHKGFGPPPDEHLVFLINAGTHLLEWVSPSVCEIRRKSFDELVGRLPSDALRDSRIMGAKETEFLSIVTMLRSGDMNVGQYSTHIVDAATGLDLPLHIDVTYGTYDVLFLNCEIVEGARAQPELFNVEHGVIVLPEHRVRVIDDIDVNARYREFTRYREDGSKAYVAMLEQWAEQMVEDGNAEEVAEKMQVLRETMKSRVQSLSRRSEAARERSQELRDAAD